MGIWRTLTQQENEEGCDRNQIAAGISWNDCRTAERENFVLQQMNRERFGSGTVGEMDGYIAAGYVVG
ncbi:hypothetical protein KQ299_06235 [Synechococcus sp. CS-603]|nr:hypothetical protein [Synechococcus sp. CS-603]